MSCPVARGLHLTDTAIGTLWWCAPRGGVKSPISYQVGSEPGVPLSHYHVWYMDTPAHL